MKLKIFQADAFTDKAFSGNPAAVVLLDNWLDDEVLQAIAAENNLSETAYLVESSAAQDYDFELRWFTPADEVDLCGHATLAAAHILFAHRGVSKRLLRFKTRSGILTVKQDNGRYEMDFPAAAMQEAELFPLLEQSLGKSPVRLVKGYDYVAFYESEADIVSLIPDFIKMGQLDGRGVLITARGEHSDFVSRCFFPKLSVNEDPVTGSAHCELAPLWSEILNKNCVSGIQLSPRRGRIDCEVKGERVLLQGHAVTFLEGDIFI